MLSHGPLPWWHLLAAWWPGKSCRQETEWSRHRRPIKRNSISKHQPAAALAWLCQWPALVLRQTAAPESPSPRCHPGLPSLAPPPSPRWLPAQKAPTARARNTDWAGHDLPADQHAHAEASHLYQDWHVGLHKLQAEALVAQLASSPARHGAAQRRRRRCSGIGTRQAGLHAVFDNARRSVTTRGRHTQAPRPCCDRPRSPRQLAATPSPLAGTTDCRGAP